MSTFSRYLIAFLTAVLCTSLLGSVVSSQFVMAGLTELGIEIPFRDRLRMTVQDFGILPALSASVAAAFLPAFIVAGLLGRRFDGRRAWFTLAGAAALTAELAIMQAVLGLMPVAGARSAAGLVTLGIAGALGGLTFALLTETRRSA
jgi:hypothetical protein